VNLSISAKAELGTEQRFQTLFEQAPCSVQLLSVEGRTLRVNQAWKDWWGTQRKGTHSRRKLPAATISRKVRASVMSKDFSVRAVVSAC
jgi:PAS domain-containing protein